MELKDFVREALTGIVRGVREAQREVRDSGAEVCPKLAHSGDVVSRHGTREVAFDIAVTVGKTGSIEASAQAVGGIRMFVMSAEGKGEATAKGQKSNSAVHRIAFTVPLLFPTQP
jgi:hypothetical protein